MGTKVALPAEALRAASRFAYAGTAVLGAAGSTGPADERLLQPPFKQESPNDSVAAPVHLAGVGSYGRASRSSREGGAKPSFDSQTPKYQSAQTTQRKEGLTRPPPALLKSPVGTDLHPIQMNMSRHRHLAAMTRI